MHMTLSIPGPAARRRTADLLGAAGQVLRYGLVAIILWLGSFKFTQVEAEAIHLWPRVSALGSIAAVGMFATTLSFLGATPGMWAQVDGIVVPSMTGAFLLKDVLLLGAALWSAGESLRASTEAGA